jgi:hypothetical protein
MDSSAKRPISALITTFPTPKVDTKRPNVVTPAPYFFARGQRTGFKTPRAQSLTKQSIPAMKMDNCLEFIMNRSVRSNIEGERYLYTEKMLP